MRGGRSAVTADIVIGGDRVNTAAAGAYVVTYNVTDSDGNAAEEVIRTVEVLNRVPRPSGGGGGGALGPASLWLLGLLIPLRGGLRHRTLAISSGR